MSRRKTPATGKRPSAPGPRTEAQAQAWWSRWPSVVALGVASFVMVATTSLMLVLVALLASPFGETAGTDQGSESGLGIGWRVFYVAAAVVVLALPVATVWSARRGLLGFLLWALVGSAVVGAGGLYFMGIL